MSGHGTTGKYAYADGAIYDGAWRENKMSGEGRYVFQNGNVYQGRPRRLTSCRTCAHLLHEENHALFENCSWNFMHFLKMIMKKSIRIQN